ncbi:hypothetical protein X754_29380 [Mesorhizobium sp. LNJC403B00]|nr:hypothetical protein X754_29380 [Mesorhizobium sp. LNJC403B00]
MLMFANHAKEGKPWQRQQSSKSALALDVATEIVVRVRTDDAEAEEGERGLRRKHRWLPI